MKKLILLLVLLLSIGGLAEAAEVAGIKLPNSVEIGGQQLQLNGYGIRKKYFFKIYVGALYTAQKVATAAQVVDAPGAKLIRLNFLYSKLEKERVVGGFAKGIAANSPELRQDPAVEQFLGWFDKEWVEGDRVDLAITADNLVSATHNDRLLGTAQSANLAKALLLNYFGSEPVDDDLKNGMLGDI